ncbi:MAG: hypothetical protein LBL34_06750 [Clostridiales bacterium]|jgi:hypothetical protein|nr:hypothetical protein [Clostridiales bacterium]
MNEFFKKIFEMFFTKKAQGKTIDGDKDDFYVPDYKPAVQKDEFVPPTLDVEKMNKTFRIDNLKQADMQTYIENLREFPFGMLTHCTRQGVRDHTKDHGEFLAHTAYMGDFADGFKQMLGSGALLSHAEIAMREGHLDNDPYKFYQALNVLMENQFDGPATEIPADPQAVAEMINDCNERMNLQLKNIQDFAFMDPLSVHVAVENVLDESYGAEKGNEIFAVFPTALGASECHMETHWQYGGGDHMLNDLALMPKQPGGLPLEAGLIFIPENARVNPRNGSLYEVDETARGLDPKNIPLAKNTISSKEYWSKYLAENAGDKNLKIVYYDSGKTPTQALNEWQEQNGLQFISNPFDKYADMPDKRLQSLREQFVKHIEKLSERTPLRAMDMMKTAKKLLQLDQSQKRLENYFSKGATAPPLKNMHL